MAIELIFEDEKFKEEISGVTFTLRRVAPDKYNEIQRRCTNVKYKNDGSEYTELDGQRLLHEIIDFVIIDWDGVVDPRTKQKVACTTEFKSRLPDSIQVRIMDVSRRITTERDKLLEVEKKT